MASYGGSGKIRRGWVSVLCRSKGGEGTHQARGENVYPAEVEKAILQHPDVEKTVVFGVPDPKWKEGIKAVCQLKKGRMLGPQELIDFVGERIARYKKPQVVEFVEDIPLRDDGSPTGAR